MKASEQNILLTIKYSKTPQRSTQQISVIQQYRQIQQTTNRFHTPVPLGNMLKTTRLTHLPTSKLFLQALHDYGLLGLIGE